MKKSNGLAKVPQGTGPVPTRGTLANTNNVHAKAMDKGRSGRKSRELPPGEIPKPTKHGFMRNAETYSKSK